MKTWILICIIGFISNSLMAQSNQMGTISELVNEVDKIAAFNTLLRDFDLNADTQNGFAITELEYKKLQSAWNKLTKPEKIELLNSPASTLCYGTFVLFLLYDLNKNTDWQVHINDMADLGTQGLSLTLSRRHTSVTVKAARQMLVDLLQKGSSMFREGRLEITAEIMAQAAERAGNEARQRLEKWQQLINNYQNRSDMDKLKAVNAFFNQQIIAQDDKGNATGCDYWQSPIETLVRGSGDCDDFAMAKYISLRLLGIPPEQLRVAVVKSYKIYGHAVLFFFPLNEKDPWVLDNLTFEHLGFTNSHILRLSKRMKRHQMEPISGLNEEFWTVFEDGLNEKRQITDPRQKCHKFGIALINSKRVLPQTSA